MEQLEDTINNKKFRLSICFHWKDEWAPPKYVGTNISWKKSSSNSNNDETEDYLEAVDGQIHFDIYVGEEFNIFRGTSKVKLILCRYNYLITVIALFLKKSFFNGEYSSEVLQISPYINGVSGFDKCENIFGQE